MNEVGRSKNNMYKLNVDARKGGHGLRIFWARGGGYFARVLRTRTSDFDGPSLEETVGNLWPLVLDPLEGAAARRRALTRVERDGIGEMRERRGFMVAAAVLALEWRRAVVDAMDWMDGWRRSLRAFLTVPSARD